MQDTRKNTLETLDAVYHLKNKHHRFKNDFVSLLGEESFNHSIHYYDDLIEKLKIKVNSLPVGFRYTGIFYIKKPYSTEISFEKYEGRLYMREDLVSWKIEEGRKGNEPFLNRFVYREPFVSSSLIKKGDFDVLPVFDKEEETA